MDPLKRWDVIDVDEAWPYTVDNESDRDAAAQAVRLMNHRVLVKEILV